MKLAIVASLLAGASAFVPAAKQAKSMALNSYESELGVIVSGFSLMGTGAVRNDTLTPCYNTGAHWLL